MPFPDFAVPGHTGGFGEPTCRACHFDNDLDAPGGELRVEGFPEEPAAGERYMLTVRLARADMGAAGFQLSVRSADGAQAGTLEPADDRSIVATRSGIQYVQHSAEGTALTGNAEATWTVAWIAPADSAGARQPLRVHAVGNAANGDRSEFGDFIYSLALGGE